MVIFSGVNAIMYFRDSLRNVIIDNKYTTVNLIYFSNYGNS